MCHITAYHIIWDRLHGRVAEDAGEDVEHPEDHERDVADPSVISVKSVIGIIIISSSSIMISSSNSMILGCGQMFQMGSTLVGPPQK